MSIARRRRPGIMGQRQAQHTGPMGAEKQLTDAEARMRKDIEARCRLLGLAVPDLSTYESRGCLVPVETTIDAARQAHIEEIEERKSRPEQAWIHGSLEAGHASPPGQGGALEVANVAHAAAAVGDISPKTLQELAALVSPPPAVCRTLELVYLIVTTQQRDAAKIPGWHVLRRKLVPELIPEIMTGGRSTLTRQCD